MDTGQRSFLENHCTKCHNAEKQKGKFRIDDLPFEIETPATAERWQKILASLNSGEMPPEDEKQPDRNQKAEFLEALSNCLVAARRALNDQGGSSLLRRLNQREYRNTIRDLLGVEGVTAQLPADTGSGVFDTGASNLFMSADQIQQYRDLALEALDDAFEAFGGGKSRGKPRILRIECEEANRTVQTVRDRAIAPRVNALRWQDAFQKALQTPSNRQLVANLRQEVNTDEQLRALWEKIPGAPNPDDFGFQWVRGDKMQAIEQGLRQSRELPRPPEQYFAQPLAESGIYLSVQVLPEYHFNIPPDWPAGKSRIRIRAGADPSIPAERKFLEMGPYRGKLDRVMEVGGSFEEPKIIEVPIHVNRSAKSREQRSLFLRERGTCDHMEQLIRRAFSPKALPEDPHIGSRFGIWIDWIEIEHLSSVQKILPPGIAALKVPLEETPETISDDQLNDSFRAFCTEAFRGLPPDGAYVDKLAGIYRSQRDSGQKHLASLKYTLATVLASPSFLYHLEPRSEGSKNPLDGRELACRLSYFLWGSPPDAELKARGESGELLRTSVLKDQIKRLLADERSEGFIRPFVHQWWSMERLDLFQPDWKQYPRFDNAVRWGAREELYAFFAHILHTSGSIRDLLKSDYMVVNSLMASYYGLDGVRGDAFRAVAVPKESARGGVMATTAFCFMGSNGHQSSPVERGAWVLRKLLNDPPPPAPANVPSLTRLDGQLLPARERISAHQEEPQCANCHRKIDPIGFGLENWDPVGQWRTSETVKASVAVRGGAPQPRRTEAKTWEIDPSAALHKGPRFGNFFELRDLVWERSDAFARGLGSALFEYALGRPCGFSDEPLLDALLAHARAHDYRLREMIEFVVESREFRSK